MLYSSVSYLLPLPQLFLPWTLILSHPLSLPICILPSPPSLGRFYLLILLLAVSHRVMATLGP